MKREDISAETPLQFLSRRYKEEVPVWLNEFTAGRDSFDPSAFFASRTVYYPGSGTDGQPVHLFAQSRASHCFIYADCGVDRSYIEQELVSHPFLGYECIARVELSELDLSRNGLTTHTANFVNTPRIQPFGFLEVLQRRIDSSPDHGPERIAVLFLGACGFAAFDALYCRKPASVRAPFAIVVEDYGFGAATESFGNGGPLHKHASESRVHPELLLVSEMSTRWDGYAPILGVPSTRGGMHSYERKLFQRHPMSSAGVAQ